MHYLHGKQRLMTLDLFSLVPARRRLVASPGGDAESQFVSEAAHHSSFGAYLCMFSSFKCETRKNQIIIPQVVYKYLSFSTSLHKIKLSAVLKIHGYRNSAGRCSQPLHETAGVKRGWIALRGTCILSKEFLSSTDSYVQKKSLNTGGNR